MAYRTTRGLIAVPAAMPFGGGAAKRANVAGMRALRGAGTGFAHPVTILLSDTNRIVGAQSTKSGRVVPL
jgi:hypothetical protein